MLMSKSLLNLAQQAIAQYWEELTDHPDAAGIHLYGNGAVAQLEAKLTHHYGVKYALCVSNATMGLLAVAMALDLQDEVFITTPYTYGASLAGWLKLGNHPIFADIDPETLTLNPKAVEQQITPNTRAILAVDIFGHPSNTQALRQIADEYGLWYIADAAQSLGAYRDGMPASALADAIVVSFTVGKSVFAGEGGAILTDNAELYQKLVWLTQHPYRQKRDVGLFLDNEFGLNSRIHPLAAVIANAIFEGALAQLQVHQADCFRLIETLNAIGLTQPIRFQQQQIIPSFFRLTAAVLEDVSEAEIQSALKEHGLSVILSPPPIRLIYRQPSFLAMYSQPVRECPIAEQQASLRVSFEFNRCAIAAAEFEALQLLT
ncbi:DegT/DnrJ/EryC1/StrS family aminotransferase [Kamptonema sp. UHCC 0994]|uniref:DegT/DnrJ/EryC1/StrS family aminotransferase n=1 Tax=Kamptonema sp. UHCC 0994 TaxID=3031329 RepID=UPI0023B8EB8C|nr:DegT/DnrJ/EryC1/StrS family aminotransferase [Kamptonema sp. UHCC 0994]MDF0555616.1 DegT/DnrJ/EryC1/StrS family aminotransferase [Kamptonema sp. UHCC 0994]